MIQDHLFIYTDNNENFMRIQTYNHDVFSRTDYIKHRVQAGEETCAFCGNVKTTKKGIKFLYQYGFIKDGIYTKEQFQDKLFCSVSCMRNYSN